MIVSVSIALASCDSAGAGGGGGSDPVTVSWAVVDSGLPGFDAALADLVTYVESETGYDVTTLTYSNYSTVVDAMAAEPPEVQAAILPTFTYLVAAADGDAEAAGIADRGGSTTYRAQIVVNSGSSFETLADLAGARFMRPDPLSTSGWVIPEIMMRGAGVDTGALTIVEGSGHTSVIQGVYDGTYGSEMVDAGGTFVDARVFVDGSSYPDVTTVVEVLAQSDPIPNDCFAFHPSVDQTVRTAVIDALQALAADPAQSDDFTDVTSWDTIVDATDADYDAFRAYLTANGVDPDNPQ